MAYSCIVPLEEISQAYRKAFSSALATVLRRIEQADSEVSERRALKWFLVLPKLLLREPRRGGRRGQGSGEVRTRFERTVPDPVKEKAARRKTVCALIDQGKVGMARRRVTSHGLASMSDPVVRATMQEKYPPLRQDFPPSVTRASCMNSLPALKETLLNMVPGVSAGFGGLRNEYLRLLLKIGSQGSLACWRVLVFSTSAVNFLHGSTG